MLTNAHLYESMYEELYLRHFEVVELAAPKPNQMFDELSHYVTRFIRPVGNERWTCAVCNRKRGRSWFWTQRIPFKASLPNPGFSLAMSELLPAFTPVCSDHCLQPWGRDA